MIVTYLRGNKALTRVQLDQLTGFNKAKTVRILNQLLKRNIIRKTGKGKITKYLVQLFRCYTYKFIVQNHKPKAKKSKTFLGMMRILLIRFLGMMIICAKKIVGFMK